MSATIYKIILDLETLEALHWNDRNESAKYEYTGNKKTKQFNNDCTEADVFSDPHVIFLPIISNLSIISSAVVFIFALLYVYITNDDYSNPSATL